MEARWQLCFITRTLDGVTHALSFNFIDRDSKRQEGQYSYLRDDGLTPVRRPRPESYHSGLIGILSPNCHSEDLSSRQYALRLTSVLVNIDF